MQENSLLENTSAVVTGAGAGVGKGIATALAAQGAHVIVAARRAENGEPAAEEIRAAGGSAQFVRCDVASRDDIFAAVEAAVEVSGRLDCLVHNALGDVGPPSPVQEIPEQIWENMRTTALRASFDCAQAAYAHLRKSKGSCIFLSSSAGVEGSAHLPLYGAVKAAQRGFAKSLALEWGGEGIRVNLINPVAFTPAMERAYATNPALEQALADTTPLGRVGDPASDIGPAAVFLASEMSRYITGQTITVDGGAFMGL